MYPQSWARFTFAVCIILTCTMSIQMSAAFNMTQSRQLPNNSYIKLNRVECECPYCNLTWCSVKFLGRYTQHLNAFFTMTHTVKHSHVRVTLYYRFTTYRKFLIDIENDFCDYMGNRTSNQLLMSIMMPIVMASSNLNHPCPYSGNITITNLQLTTEILSYAPFPSGQYRCDINITEDLTNNLIAFVKVYLTVPESTDAHDDRRMG